MRFHTRSVLEGELVLELGKLSVTYLTAHCAIFVRITEAAPRAPVRALLADRVISFGRLPSLRRASQSALATDRISRPTSSFPKTCPFHCSLRLLQPFSRRALRGVRDEFLKDRSLPSGAGSAPSSGKQKPIKIQGPKPRQPKCRIPTSQKRLHHTRAV